MQQAELRREPDQQQSQSCCIQAPGKCCSRCKKTYPATPEYFNRDKGSSNGLYCYCKTCSRERCRAGAKLPRLLKLPEYDLDKLYRDLQCEKCNETTSHIYCQSRIMTSKTVYACFSCGEENARAS